MRDFYGFQTKLTSSKELNLFLTSLMITVFCSPMHCGLPSFFLVARLSLITKKPKPLLNKNYGYNDTQFHSAPTSLRSGKLKL